MALRKILTDGDPALHKMCRPVTSFDARLHTLLDDLKETLADANGAGLAAPQVGILRRVVIVVDAEDNMLELVNPEILTQEGEQEGFEGFPFYLPGRSESAPASRFWRSQNARTRRGRGGEFGPTSGRCPAEWSPVRRSASTPACLRRTRRAPPGNPARRTRP